MLDRGVDAGLIGADAGRPVADRPSLPNPPLDRIVAMAADLFGAPAAGLALRHGSRAAIPAWRGLDAPPGEVAWAFPLSERAPLSVADLSDAPRASPRPSVAGRPPRFYAGAPVPGPDGQALGTLFVVDPDPRPAASPGDMDRLASLAHLAGDALEAHRARERAEAVAAAKAGLLADVSHELRTPLNGILGFAQALKRDGALGGEALRAAERIDEAGRGLLSIVEDALDLSRFEAGLVRLDPRPFSPARLVEDAAAMVRPEAERKGLRLLAELPAAPVGALLGDPDRLRQVILNLLSNAVKFTGSGVVRITLSAGGGDGGPVPLTLVVEDSGIGIAPDGIPRLFRRFAQAEGAAARGLGGNGLGLAISKSIVDAMGGSIAVESAPGAGARFAVSLALPRAVVPPAPRARIPAEPGDLRGLAVLVADDAALNRKLVLQMLEPLGAAVDAVADGAAAVSAASGRDYALVLMDVEMPVLGGLDATRRIRALGGAAAAVPIVALTAHAFPEQLDLCRAAGMDDHLTKPFGPDELAVKALRWARRLAPAGDGTP